MRAVRKAVAVGWTRCPSVGVPLHVQLRWHYLRSAPLFIAEFYSLNPCLLSANLPTVLLATMAQSPTNIGAPATADPFCPGAMLSLSLMAIPVFFETTTEPAQLFHQWARMYHYGHRVAPTMALATSLLYAYTAIHKRAAGRRWVVFAVAGVTTMIMVPFTLIFMVPTNNTLFRLQAESKAAPVASLGEAQELVTKWSRLHVVRSLFPLAGAILGLMGILQ